MSIEIKFNSEVKDIDKFFATIERLKQRFDYEIFTQENKENIRLHFCVMGDVFLSLEKSERDCFVSGICYSNLAGAGFHRQVIDFLDALELMANLKLSVEDGGEYYQNRNFERLKREHFYHWLSRIVELCKQYQDEHQLGICWDTNLYQPMDVEHSVFTPFGRYDLKQLFKRVEDFGIEEFAKDFFIWNNIEKDAYFYRNSALSLMWERCYYMPSSRSEVDEKINRKIIQNLERAIELDDNLPYPIEDYLKICELADHQPVSTEHLMELKTDYPIGYRKSFVKENLYDLKVKCPGNFLYEYEEAQHCHLFYDDGYPAWRNARFNLYALREGNAYFIDQFFEGKEFKEVENEDVKVRYFNRGLMEEDGDYFYMFSGQATLGSKLYVISVCFNKKEDEKWAEDFFESLSGRVDNEIREQKY